MIYFKNRVTNDIKTIEKGFNWKVFLFSWIYLFYIGDYFKAVLLLVFSTVMVNVGMTNELLFTFFAFCSIGLNAWCAWDFHKDYQAILEKKDYEVFQP